MIDPKHTLAGQKPMSPLKRDVIRALAALDKDAYIYQIEVIRAHSHNYAGKANIRKRVIVYGKDRAQVQSAMHPLVLKYQSSVQFVFKKWFKGCDVFRGQQVSDYRPRGRNW
jgi:hypothetical protein